MFMSEVPNLHVVHHHNVPYTKPELLSKARLDHSCLMHIHFHSFCDADLDVLGVGRTDELVTA